MARTRVPLDPEIAAAREAAIARRQAERESLETTWRQHQLEPRVKLVNAECARRAAALVEAAGGDKHAVDWTAHSVWQAAALRACYHDAPTTRWHGLVDPVVLAELRPMFAGIPTILPQPEPLSVHDTDDEYLMLQPA